MLMLRMPLTHTIRHLLHFFEQVNVEVVPGQCLGLAVRGGKDYGVGIYISAVERFSVAESAGLKVEQCYTF